MENVKLTPEEKEELERRGFYAKPLFQMGSFITGILFSLLEFLFFSLLLVFLSFSFYEDYQYIMAGVALGINFIYYSYIIIMRSIIYGKAGISYYNGSNIILLGEDLIKNKASIAKKILRFKEIGILMKYPSDLDSEVLKSWTYLLELKQKIQLHFIKYGTHNLSKGLQYLLLFIINWLSILIIPCIVIYGGVYLFKDVLHPEAFNLLFRGINYLLILISVTILFGIYLRKMNPLGLFVDTASSVQKLTPEITSQSKLIQSEFEKDQNFGILHSGFEKLSLTFSKIVELVLKLEKVEKKANKGNLFDSEKYIGSLRTDIVTSLIELKGFLEKQREELLNSQKELSKVMVGESSELNGNRELATKRGEEILRELDGNIGKLGEMIGKMR